MSQPLDYLIENCLKCKTPLQEYFRRPDGDKMKIWKRCPKCKEIYQIHLREEVNKNGRRN